MNIKTALKRSLLATLLTVGVGAAWAGWSDAADPAPLTPMLDQDMIAELQLTPSQQAALQQIRLQSAITLQTLRSEFGGLRDRLDNELMNPQPDLRSVFGIGVQERRQSVFAALDLAREQRLDFYESLDPQQQQQIAEQLRQKLKRFDRLRSVLGHLLLNQGVL